MTNINFINNYDDSFMNSSLNNLSVKNFVNNMNNNNILSNNLNNLNKYYINDNDKAPIQNLNNYYMNDDDMEKKLLNKNFIHKFPLNNSSNNNSEGK